MNSGFTGRLILLAGIAALFGAGVLQFILLEVVAATWVLLAIGVVFTLWGGFQARGELAGLTRRRRVEIALFTVAMVGTFIALGYFSVRYPARFDMTEAGLHSLSEKTVAMLERLETPVHIVFFHNHLMGESVELYQQFADHTDKVTVDFHDPTLNPAQARLLNVRFPGTAVMTSEDRRLSVNGDSEADIANAILKVSRGITQLVCFLDGHGEADPFSKEAHDHREGTVGDHSHGFGVEYVMHEQHGMAKARGALEELNYTVEKVSLLATDSSLQDCDTVVSAGPKTPMLDKEVAKLRDYLKAGGHALFMVDPYTESGLGAILRDYGIVLDENIVIDEAHHFGTDTSSPAVSTYNYHQITRDLPLSFFPGARSLSPTPRPVPGAVVSPIINSSPTSFGETGQDRIAFDRGTDRPGPLTLMAVVNKKPATGGEEIINELGGGPIGDSEPVVDNTPVDRLSRLIVAGDSDFATNSFFHVLGNGRLFLNAVNYLAGQENLMGIQPHTRELPRLNLTNRQMKTVFFLVVFMMPALLALIGTAVWWRQR